MINRDVEPVALDPGGNLEDWPELGWLDKSTGEPLLLSTALAVLDDCESLDDLDPDLEHEAFDPRFTQVGTLTERARRWARPQSWPLPEVIVVDPLLDIRVDDSVVLVEARRVLGPGVVAQVTGLQYGTVRRWGRRRPRPRTTRAALTGLRANGWTQTRLVDVIRNAQAGRGAPRCTSGEACPAGAPIVTPAGAFCRTCRRERRRLREAKRRRTRRLADDGVRSVVCHALGCCAEVVGSGAPRAARECGWAQVAGSWWCPAHAPKPAPRLCTRCGERPAAKGRSLCGTCSRATGDSDGT
jgi:hypothetical protein